MLERIDFVCISLRSRHDRQEHMKQVFTKLGILDRVKFWLVDKHPKGGIYGCFESHFNVWSKHGIKDYLCIFEDDIDGDPAIFHDTIKNLPNLDAMVINIGPSPCT